MTSLMSDARIIVVDDDQVSLDVICDLLHDLGMEADKTTDDVEALAKILDNDYDLAILDLGLPNFPGDELFDSLRERNKSTEVIFVTGEDSFDKAMDLLRKGAFDYLIKPIDLNMLRKAVEGALRRHALLSKKDQLIRELMKKLQRLEAQPAPASSHESPRKSTGADRETRLLREELCETRKRLNKAEQEARALKMILEGQVDALTRENSELKARIALLSAPKDIPAD